MADQLRPVCAPELPEPTRARLLAGSTDASTTLLAAVLAALFGAGAVAVLVGGVRPDGAPHAFDELAGGGGLVLAACAALTAAHGALGAARRRWWQRSGRYLSRHALADLVARDPQSAVLLAAAQRDVERIRAAAPGVDEPVLRRAEWTVARAALDCGGDADRRAELAEQADQLARWADREERSDGRCDPPRRREPAPGRGPQCGPLSRVRVR